jgi:hypothetical protein
VGTNAFMTIEVPADRHFVLPEILDLRPWNAGGSKDHPAQDSLTEEPARRRLVRPAAILPIPDGATNKVGG